jgi:hypothetical protein
MGWLCRPLRTTQISPGAMLRFDDKRKAALFQEFARLRISRDGTLLASTASIGCRLLERKSCLFVVFHELRECLHLRKEAAVLIQFTTTGLTDA